MRSAVCQKVAGPILPANFAARLCMKEVQLDERCSFQLITELVYLYQQAIEYFEHKCDPRQHEFQNRLQTMLLRPDVISQLDQCNRRPVEEQVEKETISPVSSDAEVRTRKRGLTVPAPRPVAPESLFDQHAQGTLQVLENTRKDLKQQNSALVLRLQRRNQGCKSAWKDRSPGASDSQLPTGETETSLDEIAVKDFMGEDSGLSLLDSSSDSRVLDSSTLDELEREFDEVMEQTFALKTRTVEDIREKYKQQLRELEDEIRDCGGSKLLEQVAERMRRDMEDEISSAVDEIETQRKERVRALKSKFWGK